MTAPVKADWKRWVPEWPTLTAWGVLAALFLFTYYGSLARTVHYWHSPDYQYGPFVPAFALYLLWYRRDMLPTTGPKWSWWAFVFFGIWAAMRWAIVYFGYETDAHSIFPFLIGVALFAGGWAGLRWAWPSIMFLFFALPLPDFVAVRLSQPLQRIATECTVYVVQTLGIPAVVEGGQGNVIRLGNGVPLNVEEACSGLRMLMLFFTICVGAAFVIKSFAPRISVWERIVMVVSAIPIAVISNVTRITITAILHQFGWHHAADFVHNVAAAFIMMPLALALLWGEMSLLNKLLVAPVGGEALTGLGTGLAPARARPAAAGRHPKKV
jgi:exosortase